MEKDAFTIEYYSERVLQDIRDMPAAMRARYAALVDRMASAGVIWASRTQRRLVADCLNFGLSAPKA
jgi:hypothetical protein